MPFWCDKLMRGHRDGLVDGTVRTAGSPALSLPTVGLEPLCSESEFPRWVRRVWSSLLGL